MKMVWKTDRINKQFTVFLRIAIEALNFIVIDFGLIGAILFLKTSIMSIVFMISLIWLFDRFYSTLKEKNKWISLRIVTAIVVLECVIVYHTGYLQGTITKW